MYTNISLSLQLAQDDDGGFEIASIADSISDSGDPGDNHERLYDDPEAAATRKMYENAAQPSGGAATSMTDSMPTTTRSQAHSTEAGAGSASKHRESFDGDTVFAVGDDGLEWSDGSDDETDEGRKFTRKI